MRILIIGGTSFIGPHVVKLLVERGHQVTVFHRGGQEAVELPSAVAHLYGDRTRMLERREEFRRLAPEVVLDMIPSTQEDADMLVRTFAGIAQRIVAVSSQDVYRAYGLVRGSETGDLELEATPITESSRLRETFYPYGDSSKAADDWCNRYEKILVEQAVMDCDSSAGTIVRLPAIYGPKDSQHRLFSYLNLQRIVDRRPYIVLDEAFAQWRWTHAYVENAALAIVLAVVDSRSAGRIYNVGEPEAPLMIDFVQKIGEQLGWQGDIVRVPKSDLPEQLQFPLNTSQQLIVDSSRIREELGYKESVSWEEGLSKTIQWEVEHLPAAIDRKYRMKLDYEKEDEFLQSIGIKL
ncbi:hypothetical protein PAECIP111893_04115 [Paenibacillus plantiphilus]|uniref:NAD-dependent epimerase/dehydratase domain-containing protein n=1 Tax=Paenibacillus plantiphilus TaxID=2905650 RepID=A0ABN8GTJ0_9BACL|nr:NAD-dependent epimerase/dehydratase family protein [Paenibacillus plantiphilus]CAH1216404.1 hypothetical protein PAECIP111893_04115 [Paenibacillus plantiphilus]